MEKREPTGSAVFGKYKGEAKAIACVLIASIVLALVGLSLGKETVVLAGSGVVVASLWGLFLMWLFVTGVYDRKEFQKRLRSVMVTLIIIMLALIVAILAFLIKGDETTLAWLTTCVPAVALLGLAYCWLRARSFIHRQS